MDDPRPFPLLVRSSGVAELPPPCAAVEGLAARPIPPPLRHTKVYPRATSRFAGGLSPACRERLLLLELGGEGKRRTRACARTPRRHWIAELQHSGTIAKARARRSGWRAVLGSTIPRRCGSWSGGSRR